MKLMVHALGSRKQNMDFVETKLTGQRNFIDAQYSATNND
jgi:hypothetical protein